MKILTIKKRTLCVVLAIIIFLCALAGIFYSVSATSSPKPTYTIVIDAGHGGIDGGASGKMTGVTESELNLKYALTLEKIFKEFGWRVVQTRSDMNGLYDEDASSKKKSEMKQRERVIEKENPDVVVSIHMNSFSQSSAKGAHIFYGAGNEGAKDLANSVSSTLSKNIENAYKEAKIGDYYILNCTDKPAILVECGFLSNAEEEKLLQDKSYIHKFCYQLFCGVLKFFSYQNAKGIM